VSVASANCSTERWHGEDFVLAELVGESGAESGAAAELPRAVGIGEVGSAAAPRRFGSGSATAARRGNSCVGNYR
jgi:hypothetical protein